MSYGYLSNGECFRDIYNAAFDYIHNNPVISGVGITALNAVPTPSATQIDGIPDYYVVRYKTGASSFIEVRHVAVDCSLWSEDLLFPGYEPADYVQLGWLVAALWVGAACAGMLVRILR